MLMVRYYRYYTVVTYAICGIIGLAHIESLGQMYIFPVLLLIIMCLWDICVMISVGR